MNGLAGAVKAWLAGRAAKPIGIWVLALGACMTLGFAPFGLWPVAILSLAGLWALVRHAQNTKQAVGAALVWGVGHQVTALYWLPWAFFKDADGSWVAAIFGGIPAVLGLAVYGALAYMLACGVAWRVGKRFGWGYASVLFVILWVAIEFVKGLHPMGFPWLPVGAIFASSLVLMQGAALGGVWLLSALGLIIAVLLGGGRGRWQVATAVGIVAVMAAGGSMRLAMAGKATGAPVDMIRVVQPDIQSEHKWDPQKRWDFLQQTLAVALAGDPSQTTPQTVIMPETAVAFYLDEEEDVRRAITSRIAARLPAHGALVTGTVRRDADPETFMDHYYNSLAVMDTDGVLRGVYDKRFLVPFGEYIPGREWMERLPLPVPLRTLSQSRIDFTHGTRSPVLSTPAGDAVGLICYEGIFPLQVAEAAQGARYLINITNDSWFTGTIALYQHAALARLRSVETGLPLVRVTNTGLTQVVDGMGRIVAQLPINTPTYADVILPAVQPPTPFLRSIDWFMSR